MATSSFKKVTATTSMTNNERRAAKKHAKDAANGIPGPDPEPAPNHPRREGLRGNKYAYSNTQAPIKVVPRDPEATKPRRIPVARLKGQEDIPSSDSEPDTVPNVVVPLSVQAAHPVPGHFEGDTGSDASTIIEDDHPDSDDENSEGDDHPSVSVNVVQTPDHQEAPQPSNNVHARGSATPATVRAALSQPAQDEPNEVAAPQPVLKAAGATGYVTTLPVEAHQLQLPYHSGQQVHPFGGSTDVSNSLQHLSPEELDFLNMSFPVDTGNNVFNPAPDFPSSVAGVSGVNNTLNIGTHDLLTSAGPHGLPCEPQGDFDWGPSAVFPGTHLAENTVEFGQGETDQPMPYSFDMYNNVHNEVNFSATGISLDGTMGETGPHTLPSEGQIRTASNHSTSVSPAAPALPQLPALALSPQATDRPAVHTPASPNNLNLSLPTHAATVPHFRLANQPRSNSVVRSGTPVASEPPGQPTSTVRRGSTPLVAARRPLPVSLPATPRAYGRNSLTRSISSASTGSAYHVPAARPSQACNILGSVHGSRASTPSPASHLFSTRNIASPGMEGPANSRRQAPLPYPPPTPIETNDTIGSPSTADAREPGARWGEPDNGEVSNSPPHNTALESRQGVAMPFQRIRTPPPLARAVTQARLREPETGDDLQDFPASEAGFSTPPTPLLPYAREGIPSMTELAANKAKEIHSIRSVRNLPAGRLDMRTREFLAVTKVFMLWSYVSQVPYPVDEDSVAHKAKDQASAITRLPGDEILAPDDVFRPLTKAGAGVRGRCHATVFEAVKRLYNVSEGTPSEVRTWSARDRFLFPDEDMVQSEMFNVDSIGSILVLLMFPKSSRLGMVFMDQMLRDDDPAEIEDLLSVAALPGAGGVLVRPQFTDTSPAASRGVPIAGIAYAAILIRHALERLVAKEQKKEFHRSSYKDAWTHYVRELVQHPHLGQLRTTFTNKLKEEYCRNWTRVGRRVGDDYAW